MRTPGILLSLLLLACSGATADPKDVETTDEATDVPTDAQTDVTDTTDTDVVDPGGALGSLSGACGVMEPDLFTSPSPSLLRNALLLPGQPAPEVLSDGGQAILEAGNLGGSSLDSEIIAYEVLYRCEQAALVATEGEVLYTGPGSRTDLLVEIDAHRVGVSITRAFAWPPGSEYTVDAAKGLLEGKLEDILESSALVDPTHAWDKQILHVVAYDAQHADRVEEVWPTLDPAVRADTVVVVTVTDGDDTFIY